MEVLAGPAVDDVLSALVEEVDGGACGGAADGVVDDGGAAAEAVEVGADLAGPVGEGVVDGEVGAVGVDEAGLGGSSGEVDDVGSGVLGVLDEQGADAAGRGGDEDDRLGSQRGESEDAEGGAAGADHRDGFGVVEAVGYGVELVGLGDGEFGVAAGGVADVGDDVPAEPVGVGALAERFDGAGDFAAGDGGQRGGSGVRAGHALAQGGVEQVYAGGADGDPDLAGPGDGVLDALVGEVLGGAEGVEADGVHGGLPGVSVLVPVSVPVSPLFGLKRA